MGGLLLAALILPACSSASAPPEPAGYLKVARVEGHDIWVAHRTTASGSGFLIRTFGAGAGCNSGVPDLLGFPACNDSVNGSFELAFRVPDAVQRVTLSTSRGDLAMEIVGLGGSRIAYVFKRRMPGQVELLEVRLVVDSKHPVTVSWQSLSQSLAALVGVRAKVPTAP